MEFTWNAWEQYSNWTCKSNSDSIESPEFSLSGIFGFNLRYWPNWDIANNNACLRLLGPVNIRARCKLGIGDDLVKEIDLDQFAYGRPASAAWYFPAPSTSNLCAVWVEVFEVDS